MALSRSSLQLLRRMGRKTDRPRPSPRLQTETLLVHTIPLHPPMPQPEVLIDNDPTPPDRGDIRPWPDQFLE